MWKTLPPACVTRTDDRLCASAADRSTSVAWSSDVRALGGVSTTRSAAIGVFGVQPCGTSVHATVLQGLVFGTSSSAAPAKVEIVSSLCGVADVGVTGALAGVPPV